MKIVGLPGANQWTEQWMTEVIGALELGQSATVVRSYRHWHASNEELDLAYEISQVAAEAPDLVVAKSLGTIVTLTGLDDGSIRAGRYVFIGVPVSGLREAELKILGSLGERDEPCLFIQQRDDRAGSAEALQEHVTEGGNVKLVVIPGEDHRYDDIDVLKELIETWYLALR